MIGFLLRWSMNLLALMVAASIIKGNRIESLGMGILAAGILGVVNAVIRPLVLLLTLPITILTLGLFTLVINAVMLQIVASLVPGFTIETFSAALVGALVVSLVSWLLNVFVSGDGKVVYIRTDRKGRGDR